MKDSKVKKRFKEKKEQQATKISKELKVIPDFDLNELMNAKLTFESTKEENLKLTSFKSLVDKKVQFVTDNELIQIIPYGLSIGPEMGQPMMIFKAVDKDLTIPVMINALEAGVTLAQSNKSITPVSPHRATQQIFEALGLKIEKCVIVEVKGNAQYVRLFLTGHSSVKSIKVKAADALSLCLHLEVPVYTTKEVAALSRVLIAEIDEMKKNLSLNPINLNKTQNYIN